MRYDAQNKRGNVKPVPFRTTGTKFPYLERVSRPSPWIFSPLLLRVGPVPIPGVQHKTYKGFRD